MSFGRGGARNVPTNDFGDSSFGHSTDGGFKRNTGGGVGFGRDIDRRFERKEVNGGFERKGEGASFGRRTNIGFERKDERGGSERNGSANFGQNTNNAFKHKEGGSSFGHNTDDAFKRSAGGVVFGQNTDDTFKRNGDGAGFGNNTDDAFKRKEGGANFGQNTDDVFKRNGGSANFGHNTDDAFERKNKDDGFERKVDGIGCDNDDGFVRKGNDGFNQSNAQNPFERSNDMNTGFASGTGPSHVPKKRPIEEIFQEDADAAENYLQIRAEDDNVVVTGPKVDTVAVVDKWEEADLEPSLMANIARAKYSVPRKIQSYAIPMIMDGFDVKGHAETGSGKTAAFLIPIINIIIKRKTSGEFKSRRSCPYALIIEPTRELASQLYDQARKLTDGTGVSVAVAYGKYRYHDNLREISNGCDILVGTPGRLRDIISKKYVLMEELKVLVLDEADRLLEDEFMVELREICSVSNFPTKENRQTLLFSATFSPEVQQWADELLREQNVMISNQKFASANNKVVQNFMLVSSADKKDQLIKLLKDELEEKKKDLPDGQEPRLRRTLVFVQKRRDADVLSAYLCQENIKSTSINGDRPQNLREESLEQFRTNQVDLVVATDVCARGIDIKDLDHVINFDLPLDSYVAYVHRIGRTGRLKEGMATSFYDPVTDSNMAKELVNGVRESGQLPPDFLVEAAENRLVMPSKDEDDAWGVNTRSMAGLMGGGASHKPTTSSNNDDW